LSREAVIYAESLVLRCCASRFLHT